MFVHWLNHPPPMHVRNQGVARPLLLTCLQYCTSAALLKGYSVLTNLSCSQSLPSPYKGEASSRKKFIPVFMFAPEPLKNCWRCCYGYRSLYSTHFSTVLSSGSCARYSLLIYLSLFSRFPSRYLPFQCFLLPQSDYNPRSPSHCSPTLYSQNFCLLSFLHPARIDLPFSYSLSVQVCWKSCSVIVEQTSFCGE